MSSSRLGSGDCTDPLLGPATAKKGELEALPQNKRCSRRTATYAGFGREPYHPWEDTHPRCTTGVWTRRQGRKEMQKEEERRVGLRKK